MNLFPDHRMPVRETGENRQSSQHLANPWCGQEDSNIDDVSEENQSLMSDQIPAPIDKGAFESERNTGAAPAPLSPFDVAHFWGRVEVGYDFECWPWQGNVNPKGYGRFRGGMAHRIACELVNGPAPDETLLALHSCDNPPCCNPKHLR